MENGIFQRQKDTSMILATPLSFESHLERLGGKSWPMRIFINFIPFGLVNSPMFKQLLIESSSTIRGHLQVFC